MIGEPSQRAVIACACLILVVIAFVGSAAIFGSRLIDQGNPILGLLVLGCGSAMLWMVAYFVASLYQMASDKRNSLR